MPCVLRFEVLAGLAELGMGDVVGSDGHEWEHNAVERADREDNEPERN